MTTTTDPGAGRRLPPFALTPEQIADPYPIYRVYREADPVHLRSRDGADTWYIFGYEDVSAILTDRRFGRRAPDGRQPTVPIPPQYAVLHDVVTNWLVFLDPPEHTAVRSLVAGHFTASLVNAMRPRIQELAGGLLAELEGCPVIDLVADFAAPLPILVIAELLGVPGSQHTWLRERAVALEEANSSRDGSALPRAERAAAELSAYFLAEFQRRRRGSHADDLVGQLMAADLTDTQLVSTCIHLLTAGHETTTNLLAKSVLALTGHPSIHAELCRTPQRLPRAVDELLRYDPPVQTVRRRAWEDVTIGGQRIEAGSTVVLVLGSANRDPARFPEPDRLDIDREPARNVGFGLGIHYCLGAHLARAEAEIGLGALLHRLPRLSLAERPVPYADDLVFHGPSRLLVHSGH
nr:EspP-like cytochrome P450 [uncultured bacterium]